MPSHKLMEVSAPLHPRATILLVESDDQVRSFICNLFMDAGYRVLPTRTSGEALREIEHHLGAIHLLVSDLASPEPDSLALAKLLRPQYPGLAVLFIVGSVESDPWDQDLVKGGAMLIEKPFHPIALLREVRHALQSMETPGVQTN